MDLETLIARARENLNARITTFNAHAAELGTLRGLETPTEADAARVEELRAAKETVASEVEELSKRLAELEAEKKRDDAIAALQADVTPIAPPTKRAYDQVGRVGAEKRTYNPDNDRRGRDFALDVARQYISNDPGANERLARHMQEERVERGDKLVARAGGTANFSGLVVPQYLVDEFAPLARAGRPFADACRKHDLPATGMTLNVGKLTTGTTADDQSAENAAVSDTDADDTLIPVSVRTSAGSQTVSRQAAERGEGIEDTIVEDLIRANFTNMDGKLFSIASVGLSAAATAITYTDATPTAAELYPKLVQGTAEVEAALLDQGLGDTIAVMHSRRWYWLQKELSSSNPLFGQPGIAAQNIGLNYGERYGAGFRGILPNGTPVVVDNNITTAAGAGTEDEIYFVAQSEAHLWEDPNAPMLIRAEQTKAKSLGIDLVVYNYYAFLFTRRAHAQKIAGTGLIAPTW
jgi:HK97 family phage major capsid protein